MTRVAASRPVLFVNSLTMRMPLPGRTAKPLQRIIRKARSMSQGTQAPVDELPAFNVFSPLLVPMYGNAFGRWLNALLVRRQVAGVCRRLGMQRPVYFVTMPTAWDVVRPLPRTALLYNRSDKHSAFTESNYEVVRAMETGLMRHSDRVLYVSHELMGEEAAEVGERAYFLGHGVDLDHFRAGVAPIPDDLASIPGPRIGFFGGLDDYTVDFDLLEHVAREMPNASLVLIGDATGSMERFEGFPNVHWLGFREYETIPAYGSGFDVAIMPWQRNDWIRYCNPIKLKEYLALGLPVVTTEYPEIASDRDIVRVAADPDEFVRLIQATLDDGGPADPERRRARVEPETWDARTAELLELMDKSSR
jgi:glycosyltransferase involved in cell wall biosynthesis